MTIQDVLEAFADAAELGRRNSIRGLLADGLSIVGDGDRTWRRSVVNQEFRARKLSMRLLCRGCGKRPAAEPKITHGTLPIYCCRKCGAAYRARKRYRKLPPEEFAASQKRRMAAVAAAGKKRWAKWRTETDQEARWKLKRALAAARQRRYAARKREAASMRACA